MLMKCCSFRSTFSAAWTQPAPGDSSAPGLFLVIAGVFVAVSLLNFFLGHAYVAWTCLGIGVLVLVKVPIAWSDRRGKAGLSPHGGGTCPNCGAANRIRLWSL